MSPPKSKSRGLFQPLSAALLLVLLYPLTYAPLTAILWRSDSVLNRFPEGSIDFLFEGKPGYEPVCWLIDRTPFRSPLLRWADWFGVRLEFEGAVAYREGAREAEARLQRGETMLRSCSSFDPVALKAVYDIRLEQEFPDAETEDTGD